MSEVAVVSAAEGQSGHSPLSTLFSTRDPFGHSLGRGGGGARAPAARPQLQSRGIASHKFITTKVVKFFIEVAMFGATCTVIDCSFLNVKGQRYCQQSATEFTKSVFIQGVSLLNCF